MAESEKERYEDSQLYRVRHSAAHVMAEAVLEMFPRAKYAIGPPIEDGFYYDFDLPRPLTPEDLELIEKRMRQIIAGHHEFHKEVISAEKAKQIFSDQPYKLELIEDLEKGEMDEHGQPLEEKPEISIYEHDNFVDLCRGPHVESTKQINPIGDQIDERRRCILARRRRPGHAAAHLRHSLEIRRRTRAVFMEAGGGS